MIRTETRGGNVNQERAKLEEVFKVSGIPTYTFVEPKKYADILLNLRTPGRCLVVEGPSGIGKTTAVENAIEKIGIARSTTKLSARKPHVISDNHSYRSTTIRITGCG